MIEHDAFPETRKNKPPKMLAVLAILGFAFSLFQLFSFSQIIANWSILVDLPLSLKPLLLAASRLAWGSAGVLVSLGLWLGRGWARIGSLVYWILFSLGSWIDLIWLAEPSTLQGRWPVNLAFTVLSLSALVIILNLQSTRSYFGRNGVKIP